MRAARVSDGQLARPRLANAWAIVAGCVASVAIAAITAITGCTVSGPARVISTAPPTPPTPLRAGSLPAIEDDLAFDGLGAGALVSELYFAGRATAAPQIFRLGGDGFTRHDLRASNRHVFNLVETLEPEEAAQALARDCVAYAASGGGKFTAYYEPVYEARRTPDAEFSAPLYRMPEGQAATATRAAIESGRALAGKGLELFWLRDPVDVYFLQVQGSARLALADGSTARVGYAGNNGFGYTSIGRIMLDEGLIEGSQSSAEGLKSWLRAHPEQQAEILERNSRYIFFRDLGPMGDRGPIGAYGQSLVAGRSVAADPDYIPPGVLVYIRTHLPQLDQAGNFEGLRPMARLAFNHDKGAAIKGPGRADIFWGTGARAGAEAGYVSEPGSLDVLICGPPAERQRAGLTAQVPAAAALQQAATPTAPRSNVPPGPKSPWRKR
ncbi:MAG: membrane-bound lytic murein transglycosylase A [Candidatus Binatia bacterium]|jgi:membrane-bound lytic murein transglycosylase A